jgi:hypothetical protein
LSVLFSPAAGIECIEAGASNPIVARFSALADKDLRYLPIRGLYCHSNFLGRKTREVAEFDWNKVSVEEVVSGTKYPLPQDSQ